MPSHIMTLSLVRWVCGVPYSTEFHWNFHENLHMRILCFTLISIIWYNSHTFHFWLNLNTYDNARFFLLNSQTNFIVYLNVQPDFAPTYFFFKFFLIRTRGTSELIIYSNKYLSNFINVSQTRVNLDLKYE